MTAVVRFAVTIERPLPYPEPDRVTIACYECGATLVETLVYHERVIGVLLVEHVGACTGRQAEGRAT